MVGDSVFNKKLYMNIFNKYKNILKGKYRRQFDMFYSTNLSKDSIRFFANDSLTTIDIKCGESLYYFLERLEGEIGLIKIICINDSTQHITLHNNTTIELSKKVVNKIIDFMYTVRKVKDFYLKCPVEIKNKIMIDIDL